MAVTAVAVALIAVLVIALTGGEGYRVTAKLQNASQLVKGNLVTVGGQKVGTIEDIRLDDDGMAEIELTVGEGYAPLRAGSRAIVRQGSLSGVANRYIDLQLGGATGGEIDDGGVIPAVDTQSAVDIDQLFNTFDPVARTAVSRSIRLFRDFNRGNEEEAGQALRYLTPALASSSRLFAELNRNRRDFERFITETGELTTDLAANGDDLAGLIKNLGTTFQALRAERDDLGQSIEALPDTMRRANTTFVNLRAALDDLDPLVAASKPVVRNDVRPLLAQLRPFARDVVPTARDLSRTIRRPGANNDLIDLLRKQPAIAAAALDERQVNGARRPGAFPQTRTALQGATPQFAFLRPYSTDLVGWFDDFSHSGAYDALGGFSRAGLQLSQFTFTPALPGVLSPVTLDLRDELTFGTVKTGRNNRCPGSVERTAPDGSNPYVPANITCDRSMQPSGETAGPGGTG